MDAAHTASSSWGSLHLGKERRNKEDSIIVIEKATGFEEQAHALIVLAHG